MAAVAAAWLTLASSAFAQTPRKDLRIFNDVASQVNRYPMFTVFDDVGVSIDSGVVTLHGRVTMPYKAKDLEARVAKVRGVAAVRNEIKTLPVSSFDDELRLRIARAIYGNPSFFNYAAMANPPIHIIVEHGRVTLTGVVKNDVDRMLARSIATGRGAFSVTNNLKTDAEVEKELERI
jgi:hyperosmotically inducible protein